jgi:peptide/nickel transport system permease protein
MKRQIRRRLSGLEVKHLLRSLWQDKIATVSAIWLLLVVICAVFAAYVAPHDYTQGDVTKRLTPPIWYQGGDPDFILGTDQIGRDILSRLIWGARVSLTIGLVVVIISGTFGTMVGLASGFKGGRIDSFFMRWADIQTAFPGLLLALLIIFMIGPSMRNIIIVLSINGWMVYARMVRGMVLTEKESDYIESARVVGSSDSRIMFRHLLPNLLNPLITLANLELARIILAEAILSFLGLGIQPPESSWGLMINDGHQYLPIGIWWLSILPGICISFTVLAINLFATWLRSYTDPLQKHKMVRTKA